MGNVSVFLIWGKCVEIVRNVWGISYMGKCMGNVSAFPIWECVGNVWGICRTGELWENCGKCMGNV